MSYNKQLKLRKPKRRIGSGNVEPLYEYEFAGDEPLDESGRACSILLQADSNFNRYAHVLLTGAVDEVDICSMLSELQDALIDSMDSVAGGGSDDEEDMLEDEDYSEDGEDGDDSDGEDDEEEADPVIDAIDAIVDRLLVDAKFREIAQLLMDAMTEEGEDADR